jgi:putative ABC transport system permease protein
MLTNHLFIALRHIRRNKLYSVVNVFCLAVGIAVTMTILLYVLHEHSYDGWHAHSDRIFSVSTPSKFGSETFMSERLTFPAGPAALQSGVVEGMTRATTAQMGIELQNMAMPGTRFREAQGFLFADSNFFQFFSFRLRRGQASEVLARPFTVVLTESAAKKYFGRTDPVGKVLLLDNRYRLEVTGVAEDVPSNSSIRFELIASLSTMAGMDHYRPYLGDQQLRGGSFWTWVLLKRAADTAVVSRQLSQTALVAAGSAPRDGYSRSGFTESYHFILRPLADTHLRGNFGKSNGLFLMPFSLAAGVVLLLALVNYMSLATAGAAARAREVGVRKVLGAGRGKIAGQFYTESGLLAVGSFLLGGLLFLWFRRYFLDLMNLKIDGRFLATPLVLGFFGGLLLLVIGVSGSYPSLVLSAFRPVAVLYGRLSRQRSGERVRKGFIVLQFSLSMVLVICSVIIGKQLYYLRHADTGVDRDNVVMLPFDYTMDHYGAYKQEVAALPAISQVATNRFKLYSGGINIQLVHLPAATVPQKVDCMTVDSAFIPLLGLKWVQAPAPGSDWLGEDRVLLNEAAVREFGLTDGPIGRRLRMQDTTATVSGVLKDFNFLSLHAPIQSLCVTVSKNVDWDWVHGVAGCLYARIKAHANVPATMDAIKKIYSKYDTRGTFDFQFLDDAFDSNYKTEERLAGLFSVLTLITIVIACLGLFALATFSAQQRVREIGIRKVLGASVGSIGALLSRDFMRPVLLAIVIACPLSWWVMHRWLEDFPYRTTMSWWVFAVSGLGLLTVALTTVLVRSLRAGRANPVDNLRSE